MPTAELQWQHDGSKRTEGEVIDLLYSLVRCHKPRHCIETGTFAGHGTEAISNALQANEYGHLWTVENDPELAWALADEAIEQVSFIEADSLKFVNEFDLELDFAFIDCGEPEHRLNVAQAAQRKLSPGGLMLVHDTVYYEGFLRELQGRIGAPQLHIPTLHGVSLWQEP